MLKGFAFLTRAVGVLAENKISPKTIYLCPKLCSLEVLAKDSWKIPQGEQLELVLKC